MNLNHDQEKLAMEIAHALDDMHSLKQHRKFVLKYSEAHLRKTLARALAVPEEKVRVSRGAIFTSLLSDGYDPRH